MGSRRSAPYLFSHTASCNKSAMDSVAGKSRRLRAPVLFLCLIPALYLCFEFWSTSIRIDIIDKGNETVIAKNLVPTIEFELVPINHNSTYVQSDVSKIVHVPAEARIEVHLKEKSVRRCQNPVFKGRISGWSLTMIDFDRAEMECNNNDTVIVGTYERSNMPISGTYFLEILVLLCERYDEKEFLHLNLATVCIENTRNANHRITAFDGSASIQIQTENYFRDVVNRLRLSSRSNDNIPSGTIRNKGVWVFNSLIDMDGTQLSPKNTTQSEFNATIETPNIPSPKPLFTKYQSTNKKLCERKRQNQRQCSVEHKRFEVYTFRWSPGLYEGLNEPGLSLLELPTNEKNTNKNNETHICFVGESHSRYLRQHCHLLLEQHQEKVGDVINVTLTHGEERTSTSSTKYLTCSAVKVRYPNDLSQKVPKILELGCTHAVVGFFQHFFGGGDEDSRIASNRTFAFWKTEMSQVVEILQNVAKNPNNKLRNVVVRSVHNNGLKRNIEVCPSVDLRHPTNADLATMILKEIVQETNQQEDAAESPNIVSFLDTNFLIGPVWDSGSDWNHYTGQEGLEEAKYILSYLFS